MGQGFVSNGNIVITGSVSTDNSSASPLNSGATFTGVGMDVSVYSSVVVAAKTDQDGTLYIEFSPDNSNWDSSLSFSLTAGTNEVHRLTVTRKYFRVRFTNTSASNQTYLRLQALVGSQAGLTSALNSAIQQDADTLVVRGIDSEIDIANGKYVGYSIVNKAGFNPDVDTGSVPEDIWELGGAYTGFPLTAGETITVVSSSANDTAAGTGLRTLRITGLDANYAIQTETFTLNGTTPVTGLLIFTRVHTAVGLTSGSGNTAFNAGVVSVYHTTTTANVFLSIRVGTNQSNCSAYTIPAGHSGYVRNIFAKIGISAGSTGAVDYSIWTQPALKTTSPRLRRPNATYYGGGEHDVIYGGLVFSEKTDLILRVTTSSSNNTPITGGYDLLVVKT